MAVSNVLKHLNVKFKGINVLERQELNKALKIIAIGQLYLNFILKESL